MVRSFLGTRHAQSQKLMPKDLLQSCQRLLHGTALSAARQWKSDANVYLLNWMPNHCKSILLTRSAGHTSPPAYTAPTSTLASLFLKQCSIPNGLPCGNDCVINSFDLDVEEAFYIISHLSSEPLLQNVQGHPASLDFLTAISQVSSTNTS